MEVKPEDLLILARDLLRGNTELRFRSAANRPYYASFHFCQPLAESLPPVTTRKRGSHERLIERLKNHSIRNASRSNDEKIRALGCFWDKGKALRHQADYQISGAFEQVKAEELILAAEKIRATLGDIAKT